MQKRRMKQQKSRKRAAILCLAGVLFVSLMGCGKTGDGKGSGGAASKQEEASGDSQAMGRYVETMTEVDTGEVMDLRELSDGRLVLLDNDGEGRWISEDGGATWNSDSLPGWSEFVRGKYVDGKIVGGHYVYDMKAAPDGSVAALYQSFDSMDVEEDENGSGKVIKDIPVPETGIWLLPAQGEAGTAKLFLTSDITPGMFCVWENYMALKNERAGVLLYQLDTGEQIEDDVITDFVKANCTVNDFVSQSTYSIFPSDEKGLYLVCSKGVYRHVIGGTVMEQVISGGLTSLIDPMKHVVKMIRTADDGFMAAFSEGKLSTFVYDPNISTVPSQSLTAYSLTESDILRQAIIRYQGEHPDVYVEYKVGMDETGGVTREDAVKKLNTEILAGKGPDFLILDGLPVNSYVEKGVLADLTPYLDELEKEEKLLANIRESFTEDGKVCMIPAAITISMYMTERENMIEVSDLSSLADMIEKLRDEHPGEGILETYSEDMILNALMPVSAPLWVTEAGQLNAEELSAYLEQTKRIYDACMEGLPEELLRQYQERAEEWVHSSSEISAYNDLQGGAIQIVAGNEKMALGELRNAYNYTFLVSVNKHENGGNDKNCQAALMPGSVKDSFTPYALMGINAASGKTELAGEFLREALSGEMQSLIYPTGFPVNDTALQTYLNRLGGTITEDMARPGESFGMYTLSADDGTLILMRTYVPTEQETQELYDMLSSVRTPYLADAVVEDAVRETGKWYLEGRCSLEEAVKRIQESVAIYMAE